MQEEVKVPVPRRQPRRPRFGHSKAQLHSELMQTPTPKSNLRYTSSQSSRLTRKSDRDSNANEAVEPRQRRLSLHLNVYNSVLGGIGLVSALCFGAVTVVQADTANREARIANKIARKSLLLSWVQTCAQVVDVSNSTMCVLAQSFVNEIFWPPNDTGSWLANMTSSSGFPIKSPRVPLLLSYAGCVKCCVEWQLEASSFGFAKYFPWSRRPDCAPRALHGSIFFSLDPVHRPGSQLDKRISSLLNLLLLLEFVVSWFILRGGGGDFVKLMMIRRQRLERWSIQDVAACCIVELYHLVWLDIMIGVMLLDWKP